MTDVELDRIREAYRARDAARGSPYRWDNPGYVAYMHRAPSAPRSGVVDAQVPFAGAKVLDVGCGSGYFLHRLREYGAGSAMVST